MARSFLSQPDPDSQLPDAKGRFGQFGGRFVPETLIAALDQLTAAYQEAQADPEFQANLDALLRDFVGRPSPLYFARRLTEHCGGAQIWFKREDLNHTGAHKINNALGQALLAKRMGKKRIVAETGAGQHGVGSATACALLGLECIVYMGEVDIERQQPNVYRMKLLGAEVHPVSSGSRTLKDAINEAIRDWVTNVDTTHYLLGSVLGPHPYPMMVRDFQSMIGREARQQVLEETGRLPDSIIACVGGGSNAMGLFTAFLDDDQVKMIGVEPSGKGLDTSDHAATISKGTPGVIHGFSCYLLQDSEGEPLPVYSIASGLDYPGVGPQHCYLKDIERVQYESASDKECLDAFMTLSRLEGIIPALESAHAVAYAMKLAATLDSKQNILVNLSGRGDKDIDFVAERLNLL